MNIVITGATKGIGRAIAEQFASQGFDIAVCARTAEDLQQFVIDFAEKYPDVEVLTHVIDMRQKEEVIAFADFVKKHWETVDIVVNNAGVFLPGNIQEEAEGTLETMIETNLYSAYYFTRSMLPQMNGNGKKHIFNICSVASLKAYPQGGSYSISKFALLGFSQNLRQELLEKNIRVTAVMPGATWSASWAGVELPESRLMQAQDIAISIWNAWSLSASSVVEDIILRPQLGDL